MRTRMLMTGLVLLATAASAAPPAHKKAPSSKKMDCKMCAECPMCQQKMKGQKEEHAGGMAGMMGMMGGAGGMGGMGGMMGMPHPSEATTINVANDGTILILRGGVLYKYSADLKLIGSVHLPEAEQKAAKGDSLPDEHAEHHH